MNLSLSAVPLGNFPWEPQKIQFRLTEDLPQYEATTRECQDKCESVGLSFRKLERDLEQEALSRSLDCMIPISIFCTKLTNNEPWRRCYSGNALVSRTHLRTRHCREPISRDSSERS